jgi:hypothetical protein
LEIQLEHAIDLLGWAAALLSDRLGLLFQIKALPSGAPATKLRVARPGQGVFD